MTSIKVQIQEKINMSNGKLEPRRPLVVMFQENTLDCFGVFDIGEEWVRPLFRNVHAVPGSRDAEGKTMSMCSKKSDPTLSRVRAKCGTVPCSSMRGSEAGEIFYSSNY